MSRIKYTKYRKGKKSKADWAAFDALPDDEIDYSEIPEVEDEWFKTAMFVNHQKQEIAWLPIDKDIMKWFRKQGVHRGTFLNAVLRDWMEKEKAIHHRKRTNNSNSKRKKVA